MVTAGCGGLHPYSFIEPAVAEFAEYIRIIQALTLYKSLSLINITSSLESQKSTYEACQLRASAHMD